jgi:arginine utilization protein RocB
LEDADEECQRSFNDMAEKKRLREFFAASAKDGRQLSRMIVAELAKVAQIGGPAVDRVFFSPPYYPSARADRRMNLTLAVKSALGRIKRDTFSSVGYYPYISDLSYLRLDNGIEADSLKKNMPLFGMKDKKNALYYLLDSAKWSDIRALDCPVVNVGPFGSDAHGLYERVYMPYSFETAPQIIFETIIRALAMSF